MLGMAIKALFLGLNSALPESNPNWRKGLFSLLAVADRECGKEVKSIWTSGTNQFQINFFNPPGQPIKVMFFTKFF